MNSVSKSIIIQDGLDFREISLMNLAVKDCSDPEDMLSPHRRLKQSQPAPPIHRVCFVGAGHVGGPTAAVIALYNPHIRVDVVDKDHCRIAQWNSDQLPFREPDLQEIIWITRDGERNVRSIAVKALDLGQRDIEAGSYQREPNLFFSTSISETISQADIVFLAINTPAQRYGEGVGRATDMSMFDEAVEEVVRSAKSGATVVEKSTVPCGTAERVSVKFSHARAGEGFEVLSNPEFMSEGSAIRDLVAPNRVIIGHVLTPRGLAAAHRLSTLYSWVAPERILMSKTWSAELSKLAANGMLAQRISSINSISALCEETGADINEVAEAIGCDARIGSSYLESGLGFGGSCFRKDLASLVYLAESLGLHEVAAYWSQVNLLNDSQGQRFSSRVLQRLDNNLKGKKITLLGFAFKEGTGDVRESSAVKIIRELSDQHPAEISIFDPSCSTVDIINELQRSLPRQTSVSNNIKVYENPYLACSAADAVLIIMKCEQFRCDAVQPARSVLMYRTSSDHGGDYTSLPTNPCKCHTEDSLVNSKEFTNDRIPAKASCVQSIAAACEQTSQLCACTKRRSPKAAINASKELGHFPLHIDWSLIVQATKQPTRIFDGWNIIDHSTICKLAAELGLDIALESIGVRHRP